MKGGNIFTVNSLLAVPFSKKLNDIKLGTTSGKGHTKNCFKVTKGMWRTLAKLLVIKCWEWKFPRVYGKVSSKWYCSLTYKFSAYALMSTEDWNLGMFACLAASHCKCCKTSKHFFMHSWFAEKSKAMCIMQAYPSLVLKCENSCLTYCCYFALNHQTQVPRNVLYNAL